MFFRKLFVRLWGFIIWRSTSNDTTMGLCALPVTVAIISNRVTVTDLVQRRQKCPFFICVQNECGWVRQKFVSIRESEILAKCKHLSNLLLGIYDVLIFMENLTLQGKWLSKVSFISFSTKVAEFPKLQANHGPCLMLVKSSVMLGDVGELFNLSDYRFLIYKIDKVDNRCGYCRRWWYITICIISGKALSLVFFWHNAHLIVKSTVPK